MTQEINHEERLRNQRKGNLIVAMLLPLGFLKTKGIDYSEYSDYAVKILSKGWQEVETPKQFVDAMILNWQSFGADIISSEGDDQSARLVFTDYASDEDLAFLEITRDVYDQQFLFMEGMATHLGMSATVSRDGSNTIIEVSK